MWSNHDKNILARGFSTPPASWKSPHSSAPIPMSDRKRVPSGCRRDLFHVVHKVPAGDSPYVRAKHVQLIDKDPSRAISLFWAAINAGDRVDSALKDMAVVMKQLNRSDEAIEAIKSFRHLCPFDAQESLDNVLVELYKRSGRIEEEIEMLHHKLKNIEEGIAFGGKKTKIARSQGKKIQITVEQERSRILGNLAWAYLQHHDYGLAEQCYRKALSLEPDYNKQCNLAICLMHMNRIPEAKSLIQAVSDSCGSKKMDESYAKSYERAVQLLTELDSKSVLTPTGADKENRKSSASPGTGMGDGLLSSQQARVDNDWRKGSSHKEMRASPAAVLYTQPRHVSWSFGEGDQARGRLEEERNERPFENTVWNLDGELQDSTAEKSDTVLSKSQSSMFLPPERNWRGWSWSEVAQWKSTEAAALEPVSQPRMSEASIGREYEISGKMKPTDTIGDKSLGKNSSTKLAHKSWADMVEEEEEKLLTGEDLSPCFNNDWNYKEERNDENVDSNINHQSPGETISQRLEAFDLKDNSYDTLSNSVSPRNPSVRRSLCFDGKKDFNMKKKSNRLQVFRDITPSQDSP